MATRKRLQYSLGDWMVGAFRSLLSPMPDLTHFSSALSHVYCSTPPATQSSSNVPVLANPWGIPNFPGLAKLWCFQGATYAGVKPETPSGTL